MQHSLYVYTAVQGKLAVDESTQVDLLTADGEYLYTAAAAALTVCTALTVIVILHETKLTVASAEEEWARASEEYWCKPSECVLC